MYLQIKQLKTSNNSKNNKANENKNCLRRVLKLSLRIKQVQIH